MPALREYSICKIATVTGIDSKTVATTELYSVPTGKTMMVDHIVIRPTTYTAGTKSIQAVASFGGNSATYDNYINSNTYTVAAASTFITDRFQDGTTGVVYAAGVSFRISIEIGSNATTETWAVDVFAYLY